MTWARFDDGYWRHPKIRSLSLEAIALDVVAISYATDQRSIDGRISRADLATIAALHPLAAPRISAAVEELVAGRRWHVDGDGWRIHDFGEYQRSSAVREARRKNAERNRRYRARKKAAAAAGRPYPNASLDTESVTPNVTLARRHAPRHGVTPETAQLIVPGGQRDASRDASRDGKTARDGFLRSSLLPNSSSSEGEDGGEERDVSAARTRAASRVTVAGDEFAAFWSAYPRKVGKGAARRAWAKARPPLDQVLEAISWQRESEQWRRDQGQFIPHPATWLNQGRWEDEPEHGPESKRHEPRGVAAVDEWLRRERERAARGDSAGDLGGVPPLGLDGGHGLRLLDAPSGPPGRARRGGGAALDPDREIPADDCGRASGGE